MTVTLENEDPRVEQIIDFTLTKTGIDREDLFGPRRFHHLSYARHLCFYFMRHYVGMSFKQIAYKFELMDHTSVLYGVNRIDEKLLHPRTNQHTKEFKEELCAFMGEDFKPVKVKRNPYADRMVYDAKQEDEDRKRVALFRAGKL